MSIHTPITQNTRPRILVKAAQISAQTYVREKMLGNILNVSKLPSHAGAITMLQERETFLNESRITGEASYKIHHHITVLSALLGEMHLMGTT
tara:strand:+ start:835 stop:1113 length:279 start_codon:yes stop_codon:yes gene_type:complete